jgi:glycosyltransferase involved in cell wall biosynthesis
MSLSVVIIAKNEEKMIADAIESVSYADEIIILDTGSTDKTKSIAKSYKAKIFDIGSQKIEFAKWRSEGIKKAKHDWIFYLDADERVTPELKNEMIDITNSIPNKYSAYAIPRRNFYLNKEMRHGGAWPDYVIRLFYKPNLAGWKEKLHEQPIFTGNLGHLINPMIHLTHRDLTSMLDKTIKWSMLEAEELYKADHPPMAWWRFIRIMAGEFFKRGIKLQGLRDGTQGLIEVIFQTYSRFITYARLWEIQWQTQAKNKNQKL